MKALLLTTLLLFGATSAMAEHSNESETEKMEVKVHKAKRSVKKAIHRAEEATCEEGTMGCVGNKIKNRAEESGDYIKDKSNQLKNKVD